MLNWVALLPQSAEFDDVSIRTFKASGIDQEEQIWQLKDLPQWAHDPLRLWLEANATAPRNDENSRRLANLAVNIYFVTHASQRHFVVSVNIDGKSVGPIVRSNPYQSEIVGEVANGEHFLYKFSERKAAYGKASKTNAFAKLDPSSQSTFQMFMEFRNYVQKDEAASRGLDEDVVSLQSVKIEDISYPALAGKKSGDQIGVVYEPKSRRMLAFIKGHKILWLEREKIHPRIILEP